MKLLNIALLVFAMSSCCGNKALESDNDARETQLIAEFRSPKANEPTEITELITEENMAPEVKATTVHPIQIDGIEDLGSDESNADQQPFDHNTWNTLLQKHVSENGNVNYKGFKTDLSIFHSYLKSLSENPPQDSWSKDETLAYWMNVYNAFTIKLILDVYPVTSIKDIDGPWSKRFIKIGEKWLTLNNVEHGIIRKMNEPRIHFALVCAAISCPRLYNKAFTASSIEEDLDMLTEGFLNDRSKNELSENRLELSKIFKWYGGDFKKNGNTLIDFLNDHSDIVISSSAKKTYKDYDWALNE